MPRNNLIDCRSRYVRMLDALGPNSPVDEQLRAELEETILAIDRKLVGYSDVPGVEPQKQAS